MKKDDDLAQRLRAAERKMHDARQAMHDARQEMHDVRSAWREARRAQRQALGAGSRGPTPHSMLSAEEREAVRVARAQARCMARAESELPPGTSSSSIADRASRLMVEWRAKDELRAARAEAKRMREGIAFLADRASRLRHALHHATYAAHHEQQARWADELLDADRDRSVAERALADLHEARAQQGLADV